MLLYFLILYEGIKGKKSAGTGGGNTPYKSKKSHKCSTNITLASSRDSDDSSIPLTASTNNSVTPVSNVSSTSKTLKSEKNNKGTESINDKTYIIISLNTIL